MVEMEIAEAMDRIFQNKICLNVFEIEKIYVIYRVKNAIVLLDRRKLKLFL